MNLHDLLRHDHIEPKLKSKATGEYSSACPGCGGEDRFCTWPKNDQYWCRQCGKKGDTIQYLIDFRGMEFKEAKAFIGEPVEDRRVQQAFKNKKVKKVEANLADKYHAALDPAAKKYLEDRGIKQESIDKFKIGLLVNKNDRWLTIPHYKNGELINIKFRKLPPGKKEFKRVKDAASVLFNGDCLKGADTAYITEGELDAITLIQAGISNVVGNTIGCQGFDPEWIDQFLHIRKIYICYDSDEPGQKGARSLAKRLGYNKCYNVELPEGRDINDFFMKNEIYKFISIVNQARKYDLPGVIGFDTAIEILRNGFKSGEIDRGLETNWHNVNRLTRGFHPGDLIIVTAPAKTGKTTFCLDIARHLTVRENIPVFFYCLEMRPDRLCKKIIEAQKQKNNLTVQDIDEAAREFSQMGMPLYFAQNYKKEKLVHIINLIRDAIKRYDFKLVIFDHLHFLTRTVSNVNEELGQAVQEFKLLAEEMEIPIIAIAQPRKREAGQRDEIMRAEDIKYSNAIHSDCDQMIVLWRRRLATKAKNISDTSTFEDSALDPLTLVRVEAHRYGPGGETVLNYIGEQSRFEE